MSEVLRDRLAWESKLAVVLGRPGGDAFLSDNLSFDCSGSVENTYSSFMLLQKRFLRQIDGSYLANTSINIDEMDDEIVIGKEECPTPFS